MPDPKQNARLAAGLKGAGLTGGALAAALYAASLIMPSEGLEYRPYPDPATHSDPWTVCYGHTGKDVHRGDPPRTQDQCLDLLAVDIVAHRAGIARCVTRPAIPVPVQAAMISFTYNAGEPKFCASTMARKLQAGDYRGACNELTKWVYAAGKKLPGLVTRRERERAVCLKGV